MIVYPGYKKDLKLIAFFNQKHTSFNPTWTWVSFNGTEQFSIDINWGEKKNDLKMS